VVKKPTSCADDVANMLSICKNENVLHVALANHQNYEVIIGQKTSKVFLILIKKIRGLLT
jgi:hypothetical protein